MRTPLNSLNIAKPASETRVVVAMSGGVDSCVVAALLAQENYQVIGVTLQLYNHGQAARRPGACCAGPDIHDARMVADQLNIPHYVLDYEERFKKAVIEPFAASYVSGETPVPCINCNQSVKFADLLELAKSLDADILATGHYISSQWNNGRPTLHQPVDGERDQSYFLFATSPEQLKWLRFPLGDKTKSETRELAKAYGLSIADKADSQDICFVAGERYTQLIEKLRPEAVTPGDIIHVDGQILGTHQGIMHYTIGQRRGLGIASGMPLYVIRIDAKHNQVVVGPRSALQMRYVKLRDVNWLGDEPIDALIEESDFSDQSGLELYVKLRSTQKPLAARLTNFSGDWWVVLADGDQGVAAGQACVFYSSDDGNARILGGGWISQSLSDAPEIRAAD